jgi:hypothetical protein
VFGITLAVRVLALGIILPLRAVGVGLAVLTHPVGRRLLAALLITGLCAGVVAFVFTFPEAPEATPDTRHAHASPRAPAPTGRPGGQPPDRQQRAAPTPRDDAGAHSPEQAAAAAAWYARHKGLPRERVRVLQRDRVNARLVRVLVLADSGDGRLDTAVITVRRTSAGWQVDP